MHQRARLRSVHAVAGLVSAARGPLACPARLNGALLSVVSHHLRGYHQRTCLPLSYFLRPDSLVGVLTSTAPVHTVPLATG